MSDKKIEKIRSLDAEAFRGLLVLLVQRLQYTDVKVIDDLVLAKTNSPLTKVPHGFIIFEDKLSAATDKDALKSHIDTYRKEYGFLTTFIVSKEHISNAFQTDITTQLGEENIEFLHRDKLIELIEEHYSDFWKHDDPELLEYEKNFRETILKESELKKLKIFNEKYQKLLNIYIEPRIYLMYEETETKTPMRKKVSADSIIDEKKPVMLAGDAGSGKTTTLKKLGERMIIRNAEEKQKNVPVFISTIEIFDNEFKIFPLLEQKIKPFFTEIDRNFYKAYRVHIIIDSIDEFDEDKQGRILRELESLKRGYNINYVLGTRNEEKLLTVHEMSGTQTCQIEKFNSEQVKQFVSKFFHGQGVKAEELLEALQDHNILEKLPLTPLSLSLISILFEENNLEIPATITDIYDNFNALLLGKAIVSSRLQLIDVSFRERILSLYAFELLKREQHAPMEKDFFIQFFKDFFESKTLPIKEGSLEDLLNYLINNTGILVLRNNKYVQFSHDSFMEYYGALEIFKHQREHESYLVEHFFEHNWQNAAVFYGGKSKDLPQFLQKIIGKMKTASKISDFFSAVMGCGYLLQALYQTDNKLRKEAVDQALNLDIEAHQALLKFTADKPIFFRNYRYPTFWMIGIFFFYEMFNSITLKQALKLAFSDSLDAYKNDNTNTVEGFKALVIALTLNSKRLNEQGELEELVNNSHLLKDPLLVLLLEMSMDLFVGDNYKELKKEVRKEVLKFSEVTKKMLEVPAGRLRFTPLDQLRLEKNVKLITEGITDTELLEHAFTTLTDGHVPYWSITLAGNNSETGGAHDVHKTLMNAKPALDGKQILIGIFDRDAKGLQEFNGLNDKVFESIKNNTIKKHKSAEIYAICLPVQAEREHYLQKDQVFNFFELEHYFDDKTLEMQEALEKTPLPNIFKVKDSKKKALSKFIRQQSDPALFVHFIPLFQTIDSITGVNIRYYND